MMFAQRVQRLVLSEAVAHWGRYQPERVALVSDTRSYTYRELDDQILKVATHLTLEESPYGKPVAVVAKDPVQSLIFTIGVLRAGAQVILLNPALTVELLEKARENANARTVLIETELLGEIGSAFAGCRIATTADVRATSRDCVLATASADPHAVWGIVYSSGTTGVPKGIVHTQLSISMGLLGWALELPVTRTSVVYVGRPLCYMAGLEIASTTLLVGGTLLAPRMHSVEAYGTACATWPVDLAFFIPDQVRELAEAAQTGTRGARSARRLLVMGSTLPLATKLAIPALLGSDVIESWGNAEGLGTIADAEAFAHRPRSIGRPFLSDEMRIVDDRGEPLPPWETGRVAGASDAQLDEYREREDLNSTMLRDGLVISEDLGYQDEDGYFYIAGRAVERFLRRGNPVFARDIEEVLLQRPEVLFATVIGIASPSEGHVPGVAVVLKPDTRTSEADLLASMNAHLPPLHQLAALRIVPEMPRNTSGKVILETIRGLFA